MKNKSRFILFFTGIIVVVVWVVLLFQVQPPARLGIYLVENGALVISDEDLLWYNKTSHEMKLSQRGIQRIKALELSEREFILWVDGEKIYNGTFWSYVSSKVYSGIVIVDIFFVQNGFTDILQVLPFYPPHLFNGVDLRNNVNLFNYLSHIGKLIQ